MLLSTSRGEVSFGMLFLVLRESFLQLLGADRRPGKMQFLHSDVVGFLNVYLYVYMYIYMYTYIYIYIYTERYIERER